MNTTTAKVLKSQKRRASGPGDLLADFLENTGITQAEAAERMGVSRQSVNELIHGRRNLTADMANRLAILCNNDGPEIWIRLQQRRDLWDALHMDQNLFKNVRPVQRATERVAA